ncbi:hypothetical protein ASC82_26440 [Streptomyces sp. Root431]|uniref:hypothetical protein n=1 Tax=Streptomyces sp. Root431 TaxID=1736535 RepID=UPI0006F6EFC9|nr:hypothetical protein [Streptomyces sp. Root431]KQX09455.1 hypothetical protein ASC82_26440 [Streptomyces sp. Root431]
MNQKLWLPSPAVAHPARPQSSLVTLGVLALVYGFGRAETDGWTSARTLVLSAAATLLLTAFVRRTCTPWFTASPRRSGGRQLSRSWRR